MPRHSMQGSAISIVRHNPMACSATPFSREWQQSQRIYLRRAPMAATSNRERAVKVVLVVLGVFTVVANIYPLVASFLAGLRDRKSTRLNSSHGYISYAVFCLKKKKHIQLRFV